mgnify:CR=1 FL=1
MHVRIHMGTQEDVYELKGSLVYKIDILLDFREQLLC